MDHELTNKSEAKLRVNLDRSIQKVSISFEQGDQISLNAQSLSELIQVLCKVRDQMEYQETFETGKKINYLISPQSRYNVDAVGDHPGSIRLMVYHPGPGFMAVILDRNKATELRDFIEYAAQLVRTH
jgi:hypothetical protein